MKSRYPAVVFTAETLGCTAEQTKETALMLSTGAASRIKHPVTKLLKLRRRTHSIKACGRQTSASLIYPELAAYSTLNPLNGKYSTVSPGTTFWQSSGSSTNPSAQDSDDNAPELWVR